MDNDLAQKAISSALSGDWKTALELNLKIVKSKPDDVDGLNRLSRAYFELGNIKKAKEISQKVLKNDPFNSIAQKSLEKWKGLKKIEKQEMVSSITPQNFIEEPGKTKTVTLLHLGDPKILVKLDCGDVVNINTHSHRVCITDSDSKNIGKLPDDLSLRIKKMTLKGYKYTAAVKSSNKSCIKIFIRETFRPEKYKDDPSFPSEKIDYVAYTPPELVHRKEEIEAETSESEETPES
jgi:tetratricopeptide (TPR) repeat protein